ncbi:MAG: hypothetical protein QOG55_344 [Acidobacteriaceae bacterium]|jgi:hypothetical protein|nr:hypothetical protein [Acidobacteriaceae bacterium]
MRLGQARIMALMAHAKKKIGNGLDSPRKNSGIQETKKSYTQQHPLSIQVIMFGTGW